MNTIIKGIKKQTTFTCEMQTDVTIFRQTKIKAKTWFVLVYIHLLHLTSEPLPSNKQCRFMLCTTYISTKQEIILKKAKINAYLFLDLDKFHGDVITVLNDSRNIITSCLVKMALFSLQHHCYGNGHSNSRSLTSCHCKPKKKTTNN